ncbi:recombination mediator RecR, partial [Patescibacteria group bacterium]|nr:recombination mediator RecR [Patescibacteria group bacterium]
LINQFSKLPGIGPRAAERHVFYLLKQTDEELQNFSKYVLELKNNITICQNCFAISENNPCLICSDTKRNQTILCIVSNSRDMLTIESTRQYGGLYFILGGIISAVQNINPAQLNIKQLINKLQQGNIQEIIIALNSTVDGETTAMYLVKLLKSLKLNNIKITRLAKGLPMGSDIEYADEITLSNALKYRNQVS